MNKRKYRDELIRLRKIEKCNLEAIITQLSLAFELFTSRFETTRPMDFVDSMPINPIDVDVKRNMEIEELAREYHEICREMIERQIGLITKPTQPYIEWGDLTEEQKDGRRFIAENLLKVFNITPK